MDKHEIIQVIQSDTTTYDLQDLDEVDIAEWKKVNEKNARVRCMKKIRRRVELLVKLKRELREAHKLSRT